MKVKHYIKRNLIKMEDSSPEKVAAPSRKFTNLTKLVQDKNKDNASKRIIILGEAGSGKSTELFNEASQLFKNRDRNNVPLFIPLNTYAGDNFIQYAAAKLGIDADLLLGYDKPKLIFFLDEFDQVLNKESASRQILNFVDLYRESMFIISCRSNIYANQFPEFDSFYLSLFDDDDIDELSKAELPTSHNQFIVKLNSLNIKEVSRVPFFLRYLLDLFKKDKSIPDSRTDVLDMVISNALNSDIVKLSEHDLTNKYPIDDIKKDLTLISLILEILQRNYIDASELNNIIRNDFKSIVIKRLSLLKKTYINGKEVFQFLHNNFNEYLAAECLSEQGFEDIIDFLSVKTPLIRFKKRSLFFKLIKYFNLEIYGLKVSDIVSDIIGKKKNIGINPSWANTLGFLSQLRKDRDLISYLVRHEPEIALRIELSRLTEDDRYTIFESIFNDYLDKKITIKEEIDFSKLVEIISISDGRKLDIYNYLMKYATKGEHHNHRYNASNLLCYVKGDYSKKIIETMITIINDPNEIDTVKDICMTSLVELGATGEDIIDRIVGVSDTDSDYTLSGLYYLLSNSTDVDKYIDTLIAGIPKSRTEHGTQRVRLGDESHFLSKCLENISSPSALKAIIDFLATNSDIFHDYDIKKLIPGLVKNLTKAYAIDNIVYEYAKKLLIYAQKSHIDELSEISQFFINTNTALRIFKHLLDQGFDKHYDALAVVVNEDTLGLLVDEYKQGNVSEDNVWIYIRHISFKNHDKYQEALDFINYKTNNKFIPKPPVDYKALDRARLLRKVEIIFSKAEFIKDLKSIFEASNKSKLKYQDTIDLKNENIRQNRIKYNAFVIDEIQTILMADQEKEWSFEALIEKIDTYNYDTFTFEHIFKLLHDGTEIELNESQVEFIKDYCKANLDRVDFKTALSVARKGEEGNLTTSAKELAVIIWFIKRRFNLDLPESMLLDMLSFDWIEQSGHCGIDYLLNELDDEKVKERIKQNLREGIIIASVLINHVEYCLNNSLEGVLADIYNSMNGEFIDNHDRKKIMELLIKFNGGREWIKNYIKSEDKELYLKAAELLENSEDAKKIIQRRIDDSNVDIALESAKLLIPDQNLRAIKLYVNHIIESKKFKGEIHSPIGKIDNIEALDCLFKLLLFYFENHKEMEDSHSFLYGGIMQALKNIARKDYQNLRRVDHLLAKFIKKHEKRWDFVVHLNRYHDEIKREYFANYKEVNNLREAIDKAAVLLQGNRNFSQSK